MARYKKLYVSASQACEIRFYIVKSYDHTFRVRVLAQILVYEEYARIYHYEVFYIRIVCKEVFQCYIYLLWICRVNENCMNPAFREFHRYIVKKPLSSLGVGVRLVIGVTDESDEQKLIWIKMICQKKCAKATAFIRIHTVIYSIIQSVELVVYECEGYFRFVKHTGKTYCLFFERSVHYHSVRTRGKNIIRASDVRLRICLVIEMEVYLYVVIIQRVGTCNKTLVYFLPVFAMFKPRDKTCECICFL